MSKSYTHIHSADKSVTNLRFSLLLLQNISIIWWNPELEKQVSWLHAFQTQPSHQNKMGTKNQDIIVTKINFCNRPVEVSNTRLYTKL